MLFKQIIAVTGFTGAAFAVPSGQFNKMPTNILVTNPKGQQVTSSAAFTSGAGNKNNAQTSDGIGNGKDIYNCYYGGWQNFPAESSWASFDDMWSNAQNALKESCQDVGSTGSGDSAAQIQDIYNSIQQVAESSLVDHRFILATIMQESDGCVNIDTTKNPDPSQPDNPGLMQSAGGSSFVGNKASASAQAASITQMIIDGTQGTSKGDGLVQCINQYGNIYEAARCYNSGSVDASNLNDGQGATASYVNDIANRMTGWLYGNNGNSGFSSCTGSSTSPGSSFPKDTCTWGCEGWTCSASSPCQSAYSCKSGTCGSCTWGCGGWDCSASSPCNADYSCVQGVCHHAGPATK